MTNTTKIGECNVINYEREELKGLKSQMKERITWRRDKVQELAVKGFGQAEISRMLQISEPTISRDVSLLKQEAEETIKNHIQKTLPYEYQNCLKGLQEIIKESWIIAARADKTGDTKEKLQSLSLIKDTYSTKMELLTNASLLQDSVKWVEQTKEKILKNKVGLEGFTETNSRTEPATAVF